VNGAGVIAHERSRTARLLAHYDQPGPRYTSYPTAVEFHDGFGDTEYRERLAAADAHANEPLSLYAHLPFCEERCLYCGCNIVVTRHRGVAAAYLEQLLLELELLARHLPHRRTLSQMHWGGGTPTYYPAADLERLFNAIAERFEFTPDAEIGIEVDPRVTSAEQIRSLRRLGFNRLSMGVQDFDPRVQEGRAPRASYELTAQLLRVARDAGFRSVNLDLIYGLPYQVPERFERTLEQVLTLRPERVAVYSFAFVPWIKPHMNHIPAEALPAPETKLALLAQAIDAFTRAGIARSAWTTGHSPTTISRSRWRTARCTGTSWATPCRARATWWRWASPASATFRAPLPRTRRSCRNTLRRLQMNASPSTAVTRWTPTTCSGATSSRGSCAIRGSTCVTSSAASISRSPTHSPPSSRS
jgi:hypothetical protein